MAIGEKFFEKVKLQSVPIINVSKAACWLKQNIYSVCRKNVRIYM